MARLSAAIVLCVALGGAPRGAHGGPHPTDGAGLAQLDRNCALLVDAPLPLPPLRHLDAAVDDAPVPRQLHQVWFGAAHPVFAERMQSWRAWAAAFGYGYKLWGADDLGDLLPLMPVANAQALAFYLEARDHWAASDMVRLSVLELLGGIYLDSDLQPPSDDEGFFDLDRWLPMRGVTALSENEARHTGPVGTFVTNCLLAAPAGHRLLAHLVDTVAANHHAWCQAAAPAACYTTGPWFVTRALTCAVNVLPMDEGYAWHLFGNTHRPDARAWPADAGDGLPAPRAAVGGEAAPAGRGRMRAAWARLGGGCLGGCTPGRDSAAPAPQAIDPMAATAEDCEALVRRTLRRWGGEGCLRLGGLDQDCRARLRGRCAGRHSRAFLPAETASWRATRAEMAPPSGDAPPDHPVPPGRRFAGGPDRARPEAAGAGAAIPDIVHVVTLGDDDAARAAAWERYARRHGLALRRWTGDDVSGIRGGVAGELARAVARGLDTGADPFLRAARARALGLAAVAHEGGVWVGAELTPPDIDLRRLLPWRNAAIIASPFSPTYRGVPGDLRRLDPAVSHVLFDSGRGQALGSNATAVFPGFLAAAPGHRWVAHLAAQTTADLAAVADGQMPAALVLGAASWSRSLGGAVTLVPMSLALHAGLVPPAPRLVGDLTPALAEEAPRRLGL